MENTLNSTESSEQKETLVVSCVFGPGFHKLWPAKTDFRCVLFSNNPALEAEALRKGWEFKLVDFFENTNNLVESSIQSKYVKFLQFLNDFPEYQQFKKYVYHDHKNLFSESELKRLLGLMRSDKNIFMISSRQGWTAADELEAACNTSERYLQSKDLTIEWVNKMVELKISSWKAQVYATSFIIYQNIDEISSLLDQTYQTIIDLNQPQCQTIWAVLIHSNPHHLQSIHWDETSMTRKTPLPIRPRIARSARRLLSITFSKLFCLFGVDYEKFRKKHILAIIRPSVK